MARKATAGEIHESVRYRDQPESKTTRTRRSIDRMLHPGPAYMNDAVLDTARILEQKGQQRLDRVARKALTANERSALPRRTRNRIPQYRRGGTVKRTGLARLHKGERVFTRAQYRKLHQSMRKKYGGAK